MRATRTREQAKRWFELAGVNVSEWARDHGLPASVVYAVLSGRTRGRRGVAHLAAVALGLKPDIASLPSDDIERQVELECSRKEEHEDSAMT